MIPLRVEPLSGLSVSPTPTRIAKSLTTAFGGWWYFSFTGPVPGTAVRT